MHLTADIKISFIYCCETETKDIEKKTKNKKVAVVCSGLVISCLTVTWQ